MWKSDFFFSPENASEDEGEMDSEEVMKEIQKLYLTREVGLIDAAKWINSKKDENFKVKMPQQKITVLIVGHHNEAKQKFLDLYFNESRQGGFISKLNYDKLDRIFITHGTQRRWLSGESVLEHCPHLAQLKKFPGIKDYLTTEIATRKTKSLVSFILAPETPQDEQSGDEVEEKDENNNPRKKQPFDIEKAVSTLAEAANLIFIFFDPTGRVLPKFTLLPFQNLWESHQEKFHLLLAKASPDECSEQTRENTLASVVREIWRTPVVRKTGYIPEIYCPDLSSQFRDDERLWNVIQESMDRSVERALDQLKVDATKLCDRLTALSNIYHKAKQQEHDTIFPFILLAILMLVALGALDFLKYETEVWKNAFILSAVGLLIIYFCCRLLHNFLVLPMVLSQSEEELLNRRIQFAHHALYEKERLEKIYYGGIAKSQGTDESDNEIQE